MSAKMVPTTQTKAARHILALSGQTPTTPTTPTTKAPKIRTVGVVGVPTKSPFNWRIEDGAGVNFAAFGKALSAKAPHLYRNGTGARTGLLEVVHGKTRLITRGTELLPIISDNLPMQVTKQGKFQCEFPAVGKLQAALASEKFLAAFPAVDEVSELPIYLDGFRLAKTGLNQSEGRSVLFTGTPPTPKNNLERITPFLDEMSFATNADRTNTVAAALTLLLRRYWPGAKPLILVTATKSHSGKGTVVDFIQGRTDKAAILYEKNDWTVKDQLHTKLNSNPAIGLIGFDNVRLDSAGGGAFLRGGFIEGFITDKVIDLVSPGVSGNFVGPNRYVVCINTNDGTLSADLLNRSLPIHLDCKGDTLSRKSKIGNPKEEYLPKFQAKIEAELHGMIARWVDEGCPMDTLVRHPMTAWSQTVGGILKVNSFTDFLGNYATARIANDPIRTALGILGAAHPNEALTPSDWGQHAHNLGLDHALFGVGDRNPHGRCRVIGRVLTRHWNQQFEETKDDGARLVLELSGGEGRWGFPAAEKTPHIRHIFKVADKATDK